VTGSEIPQKTRPFVRMMSALGRIGMDHSRGKGQLEEPLQLKTGEFAYLLVGQQGPGRFTLGKSVLETVLVSGLA
jgi:hypothetical protein